VDWTKDLDLNLTMESSECSATAEVIQESTPGNSKDEPLQMIAEEQASNTQSEDAEPRRSKLPLNHTEKRLQHQLSLKEKDYMKAKRKLKEKIDAVSVIWTDLSNSDTLRKERTNIEEFRKNLENAYSECYCKVKKFIT